MIEVITTNADLSICFYDGYFSIYKTVSGKLQRVCNVVFTTIKEAEYVFRHVLNKRSKHTSERGYLSLINDACKLFRRG